VGSEHRIPPRSAGLIIGLVALLAACSSDSGGAASGPTTTTTAPRTESTRSSGCGTSTVGAGQTRVDLGDRWYLRHVPPAHDGTTPVPLVLDLHGYAEGATLHTAFSGLGPYGDEKGFVTVTPQGRGAVPRWDAAVDTEDTTFLEAVLDDAERALCIDLDRVYVAGMSMGAFMTSALVCTDADRFAAAAPVAGIRDVKGCAPSRPVPVVAFHGTDDQIVAYDGGYGPGVANLPNGAGGTIGPGAVDATKDEPSIEEITAAWAGRNRCKDDPSSDLVAADVTLLSWSCPRGAEVELYRVEGGGHSWPGSALSRSAEQIVGHTTMSISATETMWAFFAAHPRHAPDRCAPVRSGSRDVTLGDRMYRVSVPDVDGPLPLVVDLHGFGERVGSHASVTGFETLGAHEGFVTVEPQGLGTPPRWDLAPDGPDARFIADVLDDVEAKVCIDAQRVYVTGHSMGAFLMSVLACSPLASRVAAWAPVAGLRDVPACATTGEPVLVQHGTDDATVPYSGGLSPDASTILGLPADGPPIPDLVAAWAARNGCGGQAPVEHVGASASWLSYGCDVTLRRIEHGPHVWPPGATDAIWRFFAGHAGG
jgi:polyhydroxybutyrate depolymerase